MSKLPALSFADGSYMRMREQHASVVSTAGAATADTELKRLLRLG